LQLRTSKKLGNQKIVAGITEKISLTTPYGKVYNTRKEIQPNGIIEEQEYEIQSYGKIIHKFIAITPYGIFFS
jgi:hypothetical protein